MTIVADAAEAIRFLSRLPLPALPGDSDPNRAPSMARMARGLPLAGIVIAAPHALVFAGAAAAGLGALPSAALALAAALMTTRGLHEDGLADVADGFGGGGDAERRLAIMRDSHIGAFGACALIATLILRVAMIAELATRGGTFLATAAIIAVGVGSRTALLWPMATTQPARSDGLAATVGRPSLKQAMLTTGFSVALGAGIIAGAGGGVAGWLLGTAAAGLTCWWLTCTSRRLIGGHTGDVAGATQQLAEIALLAGLVAGLGGS